MLTIIFKWQQGDVIFEEEGQFGVRGDIRSRCSPLCSLHLQYSSRRSKGAFNIQHVVWSNQPTVPFSDLDDDYTWGNQDDLTCVREEDGRHRFYDADSMADLIDFVIDNSYVTHRGLVYHQVVGMAMGVHNAPQMANLLCGFYELSYLVRSTARFLRFGGNCPLQRAQLNLLFNASPY